MKWRSPSDESGSQATLLDATQLFRNDPRIRWQYRIHEQIRPAIQRPAAQPAGPTSSSTTAAIRTRPREYRKLKRNLRLLLLENAEHPNELSHAVSPRLDVLSAWPARRSLRPLERSSPWPSPAKRPFARSMRCSCAARGRLSASRWTRSPICWKGRTHFPNDPELLFHEGQLRPRGGDSARRRSGTAQAAPRAPTKPTSLASVDPGLKGYKGRCALAEVYRDQGKLADAEREWRAALAEQPDFTSPGSAWRYVARPRPL